MQTVTEGGIAGWRERAEIVALLGPNQEVAVWRCVAQASPGRVTFTVTTATTQVPNLHTKKAAMKAARAALRGTR